MYKIFMYKFLELPQDKRIEWLCNIYYMSRIKNAGSIDI